MGGLGSGRRPVWGRATVSGYFAFDVRPLQREGWLRPGSVFTSSWVEDGRQLGAVRARSASGMLVLNYGWNGAPDPWGPVHD